MKWAFAVLSLVGVAFADVSTSTYAAAPSSYAAATSTYVSDYKPTEAPGCHKGQCGGHCGDGIVQPPEVCDLGTAKNNEKGSGCTPTCQHEPYCGDGFVNQPNEKCDLGSDRNGKPGEKCTKDCQICEPGYCGDGIVQPWLGETCDLGTLRNGAYNEACSTNCTPCGYCGDGRLDPGEQCDDGPATGSAGSKCDATCRLKPKDPGPGCEQCNPISGLNRCDITTSCIWTLPDNRNYCACRAGYRADGLDPADKRQFRLEFPGQEYRVFVAPGVVCNTLCTNPFPGPDSCREVPVQTDC